MHVVRRIKWSYTGSTGNGQGINVELRWAATTINATRGNLNLVKTRRQTIGIDGPQARIDSLRGRPTQWEHSRSYTMLKTACLYDPPAPSEGERMLVTRLWPPMHA